MDVLNKLGNKLKHSCCFSRLFKITILTSIKRHTDQCIIFSISWRVAKFGKDLSYLCSTSTSLWPILYLCAPTFVHLNQLSFHPYTYRHTYSCDQEPWNSCNPPTHPSVCLPTYPSIHLLTYCTICPFCIKQTVNYYLHVRSQCIIGIFEQKPVVSAQSKGNSW